jgi:hypothetical protein
MKRNHQIHTIGHKAAAVFMILTLMWLTISITFVVSFNEAMAQQAGIDNSSSPINGSDEDPSNPFGNNTEEKAPGGSSLSEEYLHLPQNTHYYLSISAQYHASKNADTYTAYHGELLVPPPNAA